MGRTERNCEMAGRVRGIGGIFLRSSEPGRLASWYRHHLGIVATSAGEPDPEGNWTWMADGGELVFSVFQKDSAYWPEERQVMLNFRVENLDDLAARLAASGVGVERREEWDHPDVGRFARIHDVDGNPIELWEPPVSEGEGAPC